MSLYIAPAAAKNFAFALLRPRGLAARAALSVALLITFAASLSAGIVLFGVQDAGDRLERRLTREQTESLSWQAGEMIASGRTEPFPRMLQGATRRPEVRSLSIRDADGRILAQAGGDAADDATMASLVAQALAGRRTVQERGADGATAVAAPIRHGDRLLGAAARIWTPFAYRFDVLSTLAPFLLMIVALVAAGAMLAAMLVRRAIAPLGELVRFVERVSDDGVAEPLKIKTGDELECLAAAINRMTERLRASRRRIQEMAYFDPLTHLPNYERLKREVAFALSRSDDGVSVVAVVEMKRAAQLLQTLDASAAQDLLRVVADRLVTSARRVDLSLRAGLPDNRRAIAARLSAQEFAVLAAGLPSVAEAARFAQRLTQALNQPFVWRENKLQLGAVVGAAFAPRDGGDADALIRRARLALASAASAPARIGFFAASLDREAAARLTLERQMRSALERNEFRAYFQPKVNLATGRIEACEALARWVRPDRTIVGPARFIPVAEESGLIEPLSDAIMREACWKAAAWSREGRQVKVAVNVSALQFRSDQFAQTVLRVLERAALAPNQLELEITESVVMEDPDRAQRSIRPLREAGVRFAIDDFGCGHSSLAALSKLPFDVIKVDQQFVRALERGEKRAATIIELIFALARTLDMEVVAEGVERREEMDFMAARGCHWVQGFLCGAAVSAAEFQDLLRRQDALKSAAHAA